MEIKQEGEEPIPFSGFQISSPSEDYFSVECVVGKRTKKDGTVDYLVKAENYESFEDLWWIRDDTGSTQDCQEVIKAFEILAKDLKEFYQCWLCPSNFKKESFLKNHYSAKHRKQIELRSSSLKNKNLLDERKKRSQPSSELKSDNFQGVSKSSELARKRALQTKKHALEITTARPKSKRQKRPPKPFWEVATPSKSALMPAKITEILSEDSLSIGSNYGDQEEPSPESASLQENSDVPINLKILLEKSIAAMENPKDLSIYNNLPNLSFRQGIQQMKAFLQKAQEYKNSFKMEQSIPKF